MRITDSKYLPEYKSQLGFDLAETFEKINFSKEEIDLGYRIAASAVFSSNIEGNSIDLNSFMNSRIAKEAFKNPKEIQEIEDLIEAYEFAKGNSLNQKNLLESHQMLSRNILIADKQGIYRNARMGVFGSSGLIYLAIEPQYVEEKMNELFEDIQSLLERALSIEELFYHASLIHLKFVHIHPFSDGNGRTARLLEIWFLSSKINSRAWKIQPEKYYKENLFAYYDNINLGVNYYELNYEKCLPFLMMLAKAIKEENEFS